ncbi:hypothetical protein LOK49_LG02G01669 [Camellia lanceoleosa]|uniref:Uncharacterized protein n=1 Tax=Camellia lanceoleosa TaxID=1840588 RepID=A0ACC0IN03_9ERIC|nr:hypothetical protein LOK49_LG02G01669 [Camellia lanceoleosa]
MEVCYQMLSTQFLKTRLIESDSFRNLSECEVKELTSSSLLDGSGRFLMWLAKRNLDLKNYLGLEIRKKCPDPHFKKKYHKRRVLQKPLVESIVDSLMHGGRCIAQHINDFARRSYLLDLVNAFAL